MKGILLAFRSVPRLVLLQCMYALQLTELGEHKSDSGRRIDELERACTAATKDAQQHEAQVSSLHRQLREAQVAVRNAEKEATHVRATRPWQPLCQIILLCSA